MLIYSASDIMAQARSEARVGGSQAISYTDEVRILNSGYRALYEKLTNYDNEYFDTIIHATEANSKPYGSGYYVTLPSDFYKLRSVTYAHDSAPLNRIGVGQWGDGYTIDYGFGLSGQSGIIIHGRPCKDVLIRYTRLPKTITLPSPTVPIPSYLTPLAVLGNKIIIAEDTLGMKYVDLQYNTTRSLPVNSAAPLVKCHNHHWTDGVTIYDTDNNAYTAQDILKLWSEGTYLKLNGEIVNYHSNRVVENIDLMPDCEYHSCSVEPLMLVTKSDTFGNSLYYQDITQVADLTKILDYDTIVFSDYLVHVTQDREAHTFTHNELISGLWHEVPQQVHPESPISLYGDIMDSGFLTRYGLRGNALDTQLDFPSILAGECMVSTVASLLAKFLNIEYDDSQLNMQLQAVILSRDAYQPLTIRNEHPRGVGYVR